MPRARPLEKKPLVEALLEVRWQLEPGSAPGLSRDPHYKFLLGRFFEIVKARFPHHEELPAASVPEEMTPHIVHHRFRATPNGWPLIQVGPGILSINDAGNYTWDTFHRLALDGITLLMKAHPKQEALTFNMSLLRFINAIALDATKTNVLEFLSNKMNTRFSLPAIDFARGHLNQQPSHLLAELAFRCSKPPGALLLKFATGQKEGDPALILDLQFSSKDSEVPQSPPAFDEWIANAHTVVEDTFFGLIEGDLEKEFSGNA